jgi:uncharacterized membrane protein
MLLQTLLNSNLECAGAPDARGRGRRVLTSAERWRKVLWTILVVLVILWLLGFSLHVGGGLIHLLLIVALVVLIVNLVTGRRRAV